MFFLQYSRAHFIKNFSITIQMWWEFNFALIQTFTKWSLHNFAHETTPAQYYCGMCKILLPCDHNEFLSHMNCDGKTVSDKGQGPIWLYSENAWVCAKWQWNARDCVTGLHDRRSRQSNPVTPVECLSLSFRTHTCVLAFITYIMCTNGIEMALV